MLHLEADQQRIEQSEAIRNERFLDGSSDAAFGQLPRFTEPDYLAGYTAKLKELPTNADGSIRYRAPGSGFAFGWVDSPDPTSYDEF